MKSSKQGVFGPRFVGVGYSQISDMHFQIALTAELVAGCELVVEFRSGSSEGSERKKERKKKIESG